VLLQIINEAITKFNASKPKADLLLKGLLRKYPLGKAERTEVYEAFYYYLRHKNLVEFLANTENSNDIAATALTLAGEGLIGLPDETQNKYEELTDELKENYTASVPYFWQEQLVAAFGAETNKVAGYLNERAGVTLFTLLRRNNRETLLEQFNNDNKITEAAVSHLSPAGIKLVGKVPKNDKLFFHPQDEASQLTALLVNPASKDLLDYCSGHGGKAIAIGTFWPQLKLYADDIRSHLAETTMERAQLAGVSLKWLNYHKIERQFDTVFIDAPCSGSGVWRRNPEDKYRINDKKLAELIATQRHLLKQAAKLVAKGGELIYVTCSFSRRENEENIEWFLTNHSNNQLVNAKERLAQNLSPYNSFNTNDYFYDNFYLRNKINLKADLFFATIIQKDG